MHSVKYRTNTTDFTSVRDTSQSKSQGEDREDLPGTERQKEVIGKERGDSIYWVKNLPCAR